MNDLISRNNIEMHNAYSLGHVSIKWLAVLIKQMGKEAECIRKQLVDQGRDDSSFDDLDTLIDIANFTADEQLEHFEGLIRDLTIHGLESEILVMERINNRGKKAVKL